MLIRCMVRSHLAPVTASSLRHHCLASLPRRITAMHGTMHASLYDAWYNAWYDHTLAHSHSPRSHHALAPCPLTMPHPSTSHLITASSSLPRITASSHHCHASPFFFFLLFIIIICYYYHLMVCGVCDDECVMSGGGGGGGGRGGGVPCHAMPPD